MLKHHVSIAFNSPAAMKRLPLTLIEFSSYKWGEFIKIIIRLLLLFKFYGASIFFQNYIWQKPENL